MKNWSQLQRTAHVLLLLDESFVAHKAGNRAAFHVAADAAGSLDPNVVTAVRGGVLIGELANPERNYPAWSDYVQTIIETAYAAAYEQAYPNQDRMSDREHDALMDRRMNGDVD